MNFIALTVALKSSLPLTTADGPAVQAAVYQLITHSAPEAGRTLHDQHRHKPMTSALLPTTKRHESLLRLTFFGIGQRYFDILLQSLASAKTLCINRATCELGAVNVGVPPWTGVGTWADLWPEKPQRYMRFEFATPMAITKRGTGQARYCTILPDPVSVFTNLARRWESLEGAPLPTGWNNFLLEGGCLVCDYQLRSHSFRTAGHVQVGCLGSVVYECPSQDSGFTLALNALTQMAFYTGVGYQTARGMGAVQTRLY